MNKSHKKKLIQTSNRNHIRRPEAVSKWIAYLNSVSGLTFEQISLKPYFAGIPPGSLSTMAKNGIMEKWKYKLKTYQPRNRASINLKDAISSGETIYSKWKNDPDKIKELIEFLQNKLDADPV